MGRIFLTRTHTQGANAFSSVTFEQVHPTLRFGVTAFMKTTHNKAFAALARPQLHNPILCLTALYTYFRQALQTLATNIWFCGQGQPKEQFIFLLKRTSLIDLLIRVCFLPSQLSPLTHL